jgi:hypothetical protein
MRETLMIVMMIVKKGKKTREGKGKEIKLKIKRNAFHAAKTGDQNGADGRARAEKQNCRWRSQNGEGIWQRITALWWGS